MFFFGHLAMLLIGHALADYPLQGDWIAKAKNPTFKPVPNETIWPGVMACHAGIHAGFVVLFTMHWSLGIAEFIMHFVIDYLKCIGKFGYNTDQCLHVVCKIVWVLVLCVLVAFHA